MVKSTIFYQDVLGLTAQLKTPRLTVFPLGTTTLILFQLGLTASDSSSVRGIVPGHGPDERTVGTLMEVCDNASFRGELHTHYCLAASSKDEVDKWEEYLRSEGVVMRGFMNWERGGKSVYFEDPDGHVGEIGSQGIWEHW